MTVRVAMWSGPRNISTAMMRAWENREDCAVSGPRPSVSTRPSTTRAGTSPAKVPVTKASSAP